MDEITRRRWRNLGLHGVLSPAQQFANLISSMSPVLSYPCNEGADTVMVDTVGGKNGTYNGVAWGTYTLFGDPAPAYDGLVDFSQMPAASIEPILDPLTGSIFTAVRTPDWDVTGAFNDINFGVDSNNRIFVYLLNNAAYSRMRAGGSNDTATVAVTNANNAKWLPMIFTWDYPANGLWLYTPLGNAQDNILGAGTWTASDLTNAFTMIGAINGGAFYLGGLAQHHLWDRLLTSDERTSLFNFMAANEPDSVGA